MDIDNVNIAELKPSEYNPRTFSKQEYDHLKESIQRFGIVDPIIVNKSLARKNIVIGGHFRLKVIRDLGIKEAPVYYVDIPDIDRERELNVRLNYNTGQFDYNLLVNFERGLLKDIGFSANELHAIFDPDLVEDEFDAEKERAKIDTPTTLEGEVYSLGSHKLMCGDAAKKGDVEVLMNGNLGRLVFTDPPYNVNYTPPSGLSYDSKNKIINDNQSNEECINFYVEVLKNIGLYTTDDMTLYWWFANKNNWINREAWEITGFHMSQIVMWLKNSMVYSRGQDYHRCYEPCMVGWKNKKVHFKNKKYVNFKDCENLDFDDWNDMLDVWYQKRDITSQYVHPTQKPIRLAEKALRKNSEQNDIVMDFFGGSGSTLLACEQMKRRCFMMELDLKYCDVIVKRWEQFTGLKAERVFDREMAKV